MRDKLDCFLLHFPSRLLVVLLVYQVRLCVNPAS